MRSVVPYNNNNTRLMAPLSGTIWVNRYQKGKTNLDFLEQEIVSGSGISLAICKSAPRPRWITMLAPHHSVFTAESLHYTEILVCLRRPVTDSLYTIVTWGKRPHIQMSVVTLQFHIPIMSHDVNLDIYYILNQ